MQIFRGRYTASLLLVALTLLLSLGCAGSTTGPVGGDASGTPGEPKVNRLVFAIGAPNSESNRPAVVATLSFWQLNPAYEFLVGVSPEGKEPIPQLATEWGLAPDGKSYRFKLRQGVPFHNGFGQVAAKDVRFTWEVMRSETDVVPPQVSTMRDQIRDVEVVNDQEVILKLDAPDSGFIAAIGQAENVFAIVSKADADSRANPPGIKEKAWAGTGPYQMLEREQARYVRYQRAPGTHWRQTAAFPEFEWRFFKEPSTMLAALLAGEAQAAGLTPEMVPQAESRGFKGIPGLAPGLHIFGTMHGAWLNKRLRPEEKLNPDPTAVWVDPKVPFLDLRVRKALNKAIDREQINKSFFRGRGDPIYNLFFHPTRPGWNPDWERRYKESYGYDPEAAKKLLAEAGFTAANPLVVPVRLPKNAYFPAADDVAEAIGNYWRAVGVAAKLESPDSVAIGPKDRALESGYWLRVQVTSIRQLLGVGIYNSTNQRNRGGIQLPELDELFETIKVTLDDKKNAELWRQWGDMAYDRYTSIPLFWLPSETVVDPKIIGSYTYPSSIGGTYTHVEYLKPAS